MVPFLKHSVVIGYISWKCRRYAPWRFGRFPSGSEIPRDLPPPSAETYSGDLPPSPPDCCLLRQRDIKSDFRCMYRMSYAAPVDVSRPG